MMGNGGAWHGREGWDTVDDSILEGVWKEGWDVKGWKRTGRDERWWVTVELKKGQDMMEDAGAQEGRMGPGG